MDKSAMPNSAVRVHSYSPFSLYKSMLLQNINETETVNFTSRVVVADKNKIQILCDYFRGLTKSLKLGFFRNQNSNFMKEIRDNSSLITALKS